MSLGFVTKLYLFTSFALIFIAIPTAISQVSHVNDLVGVKLTAPICKDTLSVQMKKLMDEDEGGILADSYNLATLKLDYRMTKNEGRKATLEEHIKAKIKDLNGPQKKKLIEKVKSVYAQHGESGDVAEISKVIEDLDEHNYSTKSNRLSNKESSIIMLAYEIMKPCSGDVCIDRNDVAMVWFMGKIAEKTTNEVDNSKVSNLLQATVAAEHTDVVNDDETMSKEQQIKKISDLEKNIEARIKEFEKNFQYEYSECVALMSGKTCFALDVENEYQKNLRNIIKEVNLNGIRAVGGQMKIRLAGGLTLNLSNNLVTTPEKVSKENGFPTSVSLPAVWMTEDGGRTTCGGEPFKSEMRNIDIWGFDPFRAAGMGKNYKKSGKTWKNQDPNGLLKKFCPAIPMIPGILYFKCGPYVKMLKLNKKSADAKVCCQEKVKWEDFTTVFASISGGIEGKIFVGVPHIAELGGLLGLGAGISLGGGVVPEGCEKKKCIQGKIRLSAYGGLYADIGVKDKVKSAIGGEFKISWKPYATARQCLYPTGSMPAMEIKYTVGQIWLEGTVYAGWVFTHDFYESIYESDSEDTFDVAIF